MKKHFVLFLTFVLLSSLTLLLGACNLPFLSSKSDDSTSNSSSQIDQSENSPNANGNQEFTDTKNKTGILPDGGVAVFYYDFTDRFIANVREDLDLALQETGKTFLNFDAKSDQDLQLEQVRSILQGKPSALIVNIVDPDEDNAAAQNIIDMAKAKDVPVIFFNREISDQVLKSFEKSVYVGTDGAEAGHMQGEMIADYLLKNYEKVDLNKDGVISYVLFKGQNGNAEAEYRTQFAVEDCNRILEESGKEKLKFFDPQNSDGFLLDELGKWSAAASNQYMLDALKEYNPEKNNMIELIIANNDEMAKGAVMALEEVSYNMGKDSPFIPVFGVDATSEAKELIAEGRMHGTIKQDSAEMARIIAQVLKNFDAYDGPSIELFQGFADMQSNPDVRKVRIPYRIYTGD